MTRVEIDRFLTEQLTCRVATIGVDGPHVSPLWYWWDGKVIWLSSVVRSQRWADIEREPRIAVVVDTGTDFRSLRGVEIRGVARPTGDVPRLGSQEVPAELLAAELEFQRKYRDPAADPSFDGKHAWLRVVPTKVVSWDFRKLI